VGVDDVVGLGKLMRVLPLWVAEVVEGEADSIEEVALDLGRPLQTKSFFGHSEHGQVVSRDDLHYVIHRIEGFRSDNRTGIDGTLHRLAAVRDRYDEIIGITIRVGRFVSGIAEPLRGVLGSREGLMLIGPPGVGKTTLLRDVSRILAEFHGPKCIVVDSSNEIGGDGKVPHFGIGRARRLQVSDPTRQAHVLLQALTNHGPSAIVADELGQVADVDIITTIARRGVKVVATVHGRTLLDVFENPVLVPLLGGLDRVNGLRLGRPVFNSALEIEDRDSWFLISDVGSVVDSILARRPYERVCVTPGAPVVG
jgi:stage III sporulation protein AA